MNPIDSEHLAAAALDRYKEISALYASALSTVKEHGGVYPVRAEGERVLRIAETPQALQLRELARLLIAHERHLAAFSEPDSPLFEDRR